MAWSQDDRFIGEFRDGLGFFVYPTKRFKTITIHAAWVRELTAEDRALGATLIGVLRRGTESWPNRRLMQARLESLYGATFRADVAKIGDKQLLSFHINVAHGDFLTGHPDTFHDAMNFLTEVLEHPRMADGQFPPDVVEQEKTLVKRQISAIINDKGQYALSRLLELVAEDQRFGLKKLGTHEEVNAVSAKDLTRYYRQVREKSPFLFTVVGDVDPETVRGGLPGAAAAASGRAVSGVHDLYIVWRGTGAGGRLASLESYRFQ